MTGSRSGTAASGPPSGTVTALELGRAFIDAVAARDYGRLGLLFAPDVRFRALVPRAVREAATAAAASDWILTWFGDAEGVRLLGSSVAVMADRLHVAYRMEVLENGLRSVVEQQAFAMEADGRLSDIALVCSGFRPVESVTDSEETMAASLEPLP